MKNFISIPLLFFVFWSTSTLFGQNPEAVNHTPVKTRFEKIIEESGNYKNYEVVSRNSMLELRDSTLKRIGELENEIEEGQRTIDSLNKELSQLNSDLSSAKAELEAANKEKTSISFLGVSTSKTAYKAIMWGIVIIVGLLLAIFVYKFKNSNILTKEAQKNQDEIQAEFDEFRQKTLEKQQEMGRKLQDERNKRNKSI